MSTAPDTASAPAAEPGPTGSGAKARELPLFALLALATAVFITSLTETLPAGLLPSMSQDLRVSESATGQTVTVYAIGTALTALPLTAATAGWQRKKLLLTAMARIRRRQHRDRRVVGLRADDGGAVRRRCGRRLAWALLAGYARRLAPVHLQGKAMAVAMAGIPVALSLGVPAGTFLGEWLGWRAGFLSMTGLTVALLV
ncbi:MFS transporter [Streptomyces californicus]